MRKHPWKQSHKLGLLISAVSQSFQRNSRDGFSCVEDTEGQVGWSWKQKALAPGGSHLFGGRLKATAAWFHSLYLLKSHFMSTPGWRKHTQLKITWNEFKPESAHLAVANTAISCSFLPSSPPASLAKFNQHTGVFLCCEDEATTLYSNQSDVIAGADVLVKQNRVMLMSCKAWWTWIGGCMWS